MLSFFKQKTTIAGIATILGTASAYLQNQTDLHGAADADQQNIAATETYILANGTLPQTPLPWFLLNGTSVQIPSVSIFKEIATAEANFVTAAKLAAATQAAGGTPAWPSASVTVP